MEYLKSLNESQRAAVECTEGPVMVIAGAGSGKTRVLTYRIAHLINNGVDPFHVLALTFTNKAAKEMKERIGKIIGQSEARNLWMGTFHSIFSRILRIESEKLGYPSTFTIYDSDDSKNLIKTILKEQNLDDKIYKSNIVQRRISSAKSNLVSAKQYREHIEIQKQDEMSKLPKLGELYELYTKRCFAAAAMDFDDLLFNTFILFEKYPEVLAKFQTNFKYVLVDEFQDTNHLQYAIIKQLSHKHKNVCVVGDDAQSIYAFRGANIQNILNFNRDFPHLNTFKLEINYRSTKSIVNAANCVIKNNKKQIPKTVITLNEEGERIKVIRALTDGEEGYLVANSIFETKMRKQLFNNAFAILYRTNSQSRSMEDSLRKMNIPYKIFGGLSFYKRKEIQDVLAYYRLTINPKDEEAFKRIINYPARGIGKTTLDKIAVSAANFGVSYWDVIQNPYHFQLAVSASVVEKLQTFSFMIQSFSALLNAKDAFELGSRIASESGILKDLYLDRTPEGISRHENVQELLNSLKDFTQGEFDYDTGVIEETQGKSLTIYMQSVSLLTGDESKNDDDGFDKVSLMTIHQSKGLEFPYVYIVGCEENLFPSQLSVNSREELEEERRLFYVALTRAEKAVVLTYADTRYKWGSLTNCERSRFVDEIDAHLIDFTEPSFERSKKDFSGLNSPSNIQYKFNLKGVDTKKPLFEKPNPISKTSSTPTSSPSSLTELQVGMQVEHERFGIGKIMEVTGDNANLKATVFFQGIGQKQLLLKFAKLKIIG